MTTMLRVRHPDGALCEAAGDDIVVYLPDPESLHLLDRTAGLLWQLAHGSTGAEVSAALEQHFAGSPRLRADVERSLADMLERGLLVASGTR